MQWECFVAKIAINPWVVFLSLQRRCTKQLLVFIRVHKSLANSIWWVCVISVIFFSDSGLQRLIKDKHCTANILVCTLLIITTNCSNNGEVANTNMSHIKLTFDVYVELPFWEKLISLLVTHINTCNFTVCNMVMKSSAP